MAKPDFDFEIHEILEANAMREISINEAKKKILELLDTDVMTLNTAIK
jgi:hypothetical protein